MEGWQSCEGHNGAEGEAEQLDRDCKFGSRWVLSTVSRFEAQGRRGEMTDGFAREKRGR